MFEDRVDAYDAKVQKSRTYILDSCDIQIADQYVETYDTVVSLQSYLNDQYSTQGMSQEYSTYLEFTQLKYDGRDLPKFCELYYSKLLKVNKIKDFKVSDKQSLFCFLSLIGEYFLQFIANVRQDIRKREAITTSVRPLPIILLQYITDLLDENTAQTNKGTNLAVLLAAQRQATSSVYPNTIRRLRVANARNNIKCLHCGKTRYKEPECYTKYLYLRATFEKKIAENKAAKELKKQQDRLKETSTALVATAPTGLTATVLPLSILYDFGSRARQYIATTFLPQLAEYTFDPLPRIYIAESNTN